MTDHYGVMGNPVAHSKSPQIHQAFAQQTGQDMDYRAILVPLDGFAAALAQFQGEGGAGLNITVPFKVEAWQLADERSARAERAGAVNTLMFRADGSRFGDNTDGAGLVRDLRDNHEVHLEGARILLLGAGGAVQGVLAPLLQEQPAQIVIANRTADKGRALAEHFSDLGPLSGGGFEELGAQRFDVIINGTAASLRDEVPPLPDTALHHNSVCYDMMYSDTPTAFVRWGRARGARLSVDGLGMLVEQAAESFLLWRGVRPDSAAVIARLRNPRPVS
jgi:shikimate dehydrogenase